MITLLSSRSIDHLLEGNGFSDPYSELLSLEWAFTEAFEKTADRPLAVRELAGLRVMFPAILQPIEEGDLIAGRIRYPLVAAFSPEMAAALPKDNHITDSAVAYPLYRMAGTTLDFGKLVRLGISGLKAELRERQVRTDVEGRVLYEAMTGALDLLASSLRMYAN